MRSTELAIIISYPTSASGTIVLLKINHENSLNLTDLVLFSFPPDAYSYHICGVWYNGSYIMATTQIKTLELRYRMSQFLNHIRSYSESLMNDLLCIDKNTAETKFDCLNCSGLFFLLSFHALLSNIRDKIFYHNCF